MTPEEFRTKIYSDYQEKLEKKRREKREEQRQKPEKREEENIWDDKTWVTVDGESMNLPDDFDGGTEED